MVEILVVIAVMASISAMSYVTVTNVSQSSANAKLESDVRVLNQSVDMYRAIVNSTNLSTITDPEDVLVELKSHASEDTAGKFVGASKHMMDMRVVAPRNDPEVWQSSAEAGTAQARAVWVPAEQRFVVRNSGAAGIKKFRFLRDDEGETLAASEERDRQSFKDGAVATGWVWDYAYDENAGNQQIVSPQVNTAPVTGFIGRPDLPFGNPWTITDPLGRVDVSHVYREAGYQSRLALVSLEGMENYDLTSNEGRYAFMMELVRRAAQGDRAQTIIDVSQSSSGNGAQTFNQTYYFRPGDTVAAILIPNASFQTTYNQMQTKSTNNQTFPLTSLNLGTDQPPFYANQIASLGNNGYGIEDLVANGSSDLDYDDLVFTASGLGQAENSTMRTIDPYTYYPTRLRQLGRSGQWSGLQSALSNAGIIQTQN